MKTLFLDCFSGISGNMFIGMLLDGGVPYDKFCQAMDGLGLENYEFQYKPVSKSGIQATYYNVKLNRVSKIKALLHGHGHAHRGLREITDIIRASAMEDSIREKSLAVFQLLAEAEAHVHGVSVEKIHFHEVGAVDCILDIVGTIWALDYLGIEQIGTTPLHVGSGFVHCAHGTMPVPAPATAELLAGLPCYATTVKGELVTPTGAALVKVLASYAGPRPKEFTHSITAYGAGTKNLEIPNVLRGFIGEAEPFK